MAIDLWLFGYLRLCCPTEQGTALFEAMREAQITPKALKRDEKNGEILFSCSRRNAAQLRAKFPALPLVERGRGGVPVLCGRLLHRPGLLGGIVLAFLMLLASRMTVWDIDVTGNDVVPDEELLQELSELGLYSGCFLPAVDGEEIALRLRLADSRISYASVCFKGTVAFVQIREAVSWESTSKEPANIVAARDGVVTLPLAYAGECLVREGDVVRAGQILISGVIESERHGQRLTRAAGQILARTTHTYTVRVPFSYVEKYYTGENSLALSLHFFAFCGNFFKSTRNIDITCDIITENEPQYLSNGRKLPLWISSTRYLGYESVSATRTAEEALAMAYDELEMQIANDSVGRSVLERTVELCPDADGITLICTLICEEDIALCSELAAELNH